MNISGLPQINLQPGMQNNEQVKKLQSWLIQNGFNIPSGPTGNYGPETKAAVAELQNKLGMKVAPGSEGYFGPQTIGAVTKASQQTTDAKATGEKTSSATIQPKGITYDPSFASFGVTQDKWNQMTPEQQGIIAVSYGTAKSLYSANASDVTVQKALEVAAKDPSIVARYADAFKLDTQAFQQNLEQIRTASQTTQTAEQMRFEAERKALAEAHAAAGTAYSGFRGKAQETLGKTEQGIVTSSRAQLQKQLQDATTAFEQKYGTAATKPASVEFANPLSTADTSISGQYVPQTGTPETVSGQLAGGITGTEPVAKSADIASTASQYINMGTQVPVKGITF